MEKKNNNQNISEDIMNLVIARLETIPSNKKQDDIGKKMIEMQLAYLRSLGKLPTQDLQNASATN